MQNYSIGAFSQEIEDLTFKIICFVFLSFYALAL